MAEKFAKRILELINDKELRNRIVETAYNGCDKYKGEEVLKVLSRIINESAKG